jgi:hypothetical protein
MMSGRGKFCLPFSAAPAVAVAFFSLNLGACDEPGEFTQPLKTAHTVAADPEYLPYGVAIPHDAVLTQSPEPYDPAKHGQPMKNSDPQANLAASSSFNLADKFPEVRSRREKKVRAESTSFPGHGDSGLSVTFAGIHVRNDAQRDVVIPSSQPDTTVMYAPTHLPQGASCIEAVTVHRRERSSATRHYHGFWDWCADQRGETNTFKVLESMSDSWMSKYTRLYAGYGGGPLEPSFYVNVSSESPDNPVGGCWKGMLYNFNTGVWEQKWRSCGTGLLNRRDGLIQGWTMWEQWFMQGCPTLPNIKASFIRKLGTDFSWQDVSSSEMGEFWQGCFLPPGQGVYTLYWPVPGEWQAKTPN